MTDYQYQTRLKDLRRQLDQLTPDEQTWQSDTLRKIDQLEKEINDCIRITAYRLRLRK